MQVTVRKGWATGGKDVRESFWGPGGDEQVPDAYEKIKPDINQIHTLLF